MNIATSTDRRRYFDKVVFRVVDYFHTHDEGAAKLLSSNRAKAFAQSAATRNGVVAEPPKEYA